MISACCAARRCVWSAPIRFYRRFLSPLLPPACRFKPTCSAYALEAHTDARPVEGLVARGEAAVALPSHHLAGRLVRLRSGAPAAHPLASDTSHGNNKNLMLAVVLSAAVLFGWQYFVAMPQMKAEQARQAALAKQDKRAGGKPRQAGAGMPGVGAPATAMSRDGGAEGRRRARDDRHADGRRLAAAERRALRRSAAEEISRDHRSQELRRSCCSRPKSTDYPYYADFGWVGARRT